MNDYFVGVTFGDDTLNFWDSKYKEIQYFVIQYFV